MKAWLKASRHLPKKQFFKTLKRKLIGHYNYYYVRGNSRSVWTFYSKVIEYAKKWLNRRSQCKSYNWEKFKRVLRYTKIPRPDRRKRDVCIRLRWDKPMRKRVQPRNRIAGAVGKANDAIPHVRDCVGGAG